MILGDLAESDLAMDLPQDWADRSVADYLVRLREAQAILIRKTRDFLDLNQKKRRRTGGAVIPEGVRFKEGQYVLLQYPSRPPNKLAGLYRGPLVIHSIDRPDLVQLRDLLNNKLQLVHTSRLRVFEHPAEMTEEEAAALAAADMDEFYVDRILEHRGKGSNPNK